MTRPLRMAWIIAALSLAASGCSTLSGGRVGMANGTRSSASSGGERVRVGTVTGGEVESAELGSPENRGRADGRISGRVIDIDGKPVPNAEVRLADGSSRGGRDLLATTDDAGGFTLRGLRPNASYTLVARGDADRPAVEGRAITRAPNGNVRIRLLPSEDAELADQQAEPATTPSRRVGRVSDRQELDEFLDEDSKPDPSRPDTRVNDADLPPAKDEEEDEEAPAAPIDEIDSAMKPRPARLAWQSSGKGTSDSAAVKASTLDRPGKPEASPVQPIAPDDDGPNPLPPAKEEPAKTIDPPIVEPSAPKSGLDVPPVETAPPDERDIFQPDPSPPPVFSDSAKDSSIPADVGPRRRATWAEIAAANDEPKGGAGLPISTRRLPPNDLEAAKVATKPSAERGGRFGLLGMGRAKPAPTADAEPPALAPLVVAPATCQFDSRDKRLIDFQLPGLDGKPVRLKDMDSDYVLLDFWGTWCGPCRESIPHLVELQNRYGAKNLRVVGVATEHEATAAERAKKVETVATSLGVNYPLLLSEADGKACPLQEALHIQAYPTLVLLDRSGRIIWRGTGAEGVTLSRLEREIASRTAPAVLRR